MGTISNVKLGPCSVKLGGVDLGHTKGGVTVMYTPEYKDIQVDQYGNTVAERVLIGEKLTAQVPLAEATLANIENAIPAATDVGSARATIGKDAGERMAQYALELVLHPLANASSDLSEDVVIHKAIVDGEIEIAFNNEDERVLNVTFMALLDETKTDGNRLGFFGDSTG